MNIDLIAKRFILFFIFIILLLPPLIVMAEMIRGVERQGSCAIVGMRAEECQLIALQRARAAAIEQAAGVAVASGTVVTNAILRADFIKSYARGLIVKEKVEWLPLGQYPKDSSTPPIPEYRVRLTADVYVPKPKVQPFGLQARASGAVFKNGERASLEVRTSREALLGIFNITADDTVVMLFPNEHERENRITQGRTLLFPEKHSKIELVMQTLPGHKRDAEAFYIVALDSGHPKNFGDLFRPGQPMGFTDFFRRYSEIADSCEDVILPYEVMEAKIPSPIEEKSKCSSLRAKRSNPEGCDGFKAEPISS